MVCLFDSLVLILFWCMTSLCVLLPVLMYPLASDWLPHPNWFHVSRYLHLPLFLCQFTSSLSLVCFLPMLLSFLPCHVFFNTWQLCTPYFLFYIFINADSFN